MAKDTERVLEGTIDAFKRLKQEIKGYKDELATLKVGSEEWNATAKKLANAQKQVDAITQAAKGNLSAYNKEQANSINELKAKIKVLNQERNAMDMNSKEYAEATKELKVLNDQLRKSGTDAGDWKANVGNYANSLKDAFKDLGTAAGGLTGSIGGLNAGMLKLASNPVGAAILAVVSAIKFLVEGIKSSEENTNRWREAMIPVKTILVMIQEAAQNVASKFLDWVESLKATETQSKAFKTALQVIITLFEQTKTRIKNLIEGVQSLTKHIKEYIEKFKEWANGLKKTFQPVIDFVDKIADRIKAKLQPVVDWIIDKYNKLAKTDLGKVFGLQTIEQVKESWDKAGQVVEDLGDKYEETKGKVEALTKAQNALAGALAGLTLKQAQLKNEVEAANRAYQEALENKDYVAAQEALNKKKEKEIELAKTNVAIKAEEANVLRQELSLTQSTAQEKLALARADAAVIEAQGQVEATAASAAKEQKKLNSLIDAKTKEEKARALKEAVQELNLELDKYAQKYNSAMAAIEKAKSPEGADITSESLNAYYDEVISNAQKEYEAYADMQNAKIAKLEEWLEVQRAAGVEEKDLATQVRDLEKMRLEQLEGFPTQYKKMVETQNEADKDRVKTLKALQRSEIKGYADLFDAVSGLFEENTIAYKATATAKALINTYLAATGALADTPGGAVARGVAMAATLAAGIAQVVQIWKTNAKGETNVSSSVSTPAVAEPVVQETNPYSYSRQVQTYEEEDKLNQPIYVKVTDINAVQERVKVVENESSY